MHKTKSPQQGNEKQFSLYSINVDKLLQKEKENYKFHHEYLLMSLNQDTHQIKAVLNGSKKHNNNKRQRSPIINNLYVPTQQSSTNNLTNSHYKQFVKNISFFNIKSIPLESRPLQQNKRYKASNIFTNINKRNTMFQIENISNNPKTPPSKAQINYHRKSEHKLTEPILKTPITNKQTVFDNKLQKYYQFIDKIWALHKIEVPIVDHYKIPPKVYVGPGNNSVLIKSLFKKRWWWLIEDSNNDVNLIWSQLKDKNFFEYEKMVRSHHTEVSDDTTIEQQSTNRSANNKVKSIDIKKKSSEKSIRSFKEVSVQTKFVLRNLDLVLHNHFECNYYLGNKKALYYNMKAYYDSLNKNVFDFLPLTFHVTNIQDVAYEEFAKFYKKNEECKQNKNLWILKPGEYTNRGKGISLHSDIKQIAEIINSKQKHPDGKLKTYIIQAYIEKPLLYHKRKFDIRCYIVLTNLNESIKGYWYKQGYIRTSSSEFQLENFNSFIHLTNDAVQKHSQTYGKFQKGNKLSYHQFQKYLELKYANKYDFYGSVYPVMKEVALDAIKSSYLILSGQKKSNIFQIFGLDFMIDQNFRPWLIQINTNPCLETSSPVLERIIPNLLDDMFKISIDSIFPPPKIWPLSKRHDLSNAQKNHLELIFDQCSYTCKQELKYQTKMGEIQQDEQIYQEDIS